MLFYSLKMSHRHHHRHHHNHQRHLHHLHRHHQHLVIDFKCGFSKRYEIDGRKRIKNQGVHFNVVYLSMPYSLVLNFINFHL